MTTPDLSIIIVSWNVRELLQNCLCSVVAQQGLAQPRLRLQIIVVDNASDDGSVEMVAEQFPQVKMIACSDNVGFPKGNNLGLVQANGRFILLLNPDTVVHEGAFAQMIRYLQQNEQVGVLGAQLLNEDGTVQSSRRRFPTLKTAFFESTWLEPYAPRAVLDDYYARDVYVDATGDEETAVVDWVMGACLMTRQEVVAQVGGLDEAYFMYSEELDYCRRIKQAGWQVVYYPSAKVTHLLGKSSEQAITHRHINFNQAKLRYFRKYHGRLAAAVLRTFLLLSYSWQLILEAVKGVVGHKRPLRWQRVRAYWLVLRSGLHPAGF
ncbi:dTDP-Rha:A-D-GlcNAc-diphosphoryl polyprenol, A-3-L-rhamnosyl transferase WbbL [hydrothermal vent metagenome]|uniref:dTDP-Rha:A-D-GlcNAc-diphosphoryl polyprenol, A-3-L-rhamnosyl transferase WbbL n=1 Tax=hydrothermal vent metagenome TaxID=652676 RepID=A0A3B0UNA3_9ZZZZ